MRITTVRGLKTVIRITATAMNVEAIATSAICSSLILFAPTLARIIKQLTNAVFGFLQMLQRGAGVNKVEDSLVAAYRLHLNENMPPPPLMAHRTG